MNAPSEKTKIAIGVRTARTALGWNQEEFAERMGVAKSTVARIETLEVNARADFLTKALAVFKRAGVSIDLLDDGKVTVEVTAAALAEAQARLDDEAMRRADRKRVGQKQAAGEAGRGDGVEELSRSNNPHRGTW